MTMDALDADLAYERLENLVDEHGELKRQVAVLQIQNGRLKSERDAAERKFAISHEENREWGEAYAELVRRYDIIFESREAAFKQCGDLSDGVRIALGMDIIRGPGGGGVNPGDKVLIAAVADLRRECDELFDALHTDRLT